MTQEFAKNVSSRTTLKDFLLSFSQKTKKSLHSSYFVLSTIKKSLPLDRFEKDNYIYRIVQVYPKPELSVFSYVLEDSAAVVIQEFGRKAIKVSEPHSSFTKGRVLWEMISKKLE